MQIGSIYEECKALEQTRFHRDRTAVLEPLTRIFPTDLRLQTTSKTENRNVPVFIARSEIGVRCEVAFRRTS